MESRYLAPRTFVHEVRHVRAAALMKQTSRMNRVVRQCRSVDLQLLVIIALFVVLFLQAC